MEFHVGYYITGKERKKLTKTMERACINDSTHDFDCTSNFCGVCGGKIELMPVVEERTLWYGDIPDEDITDHFLFPEYNSAPEGEIIGVSNYTDCGKVDTDGDEYLIVDSEIDKKQLYEDFMKRHEHDIELLKEHVYDDVEIKFGILTYDY